MYKYLNLNYIIFLNELFTFNFFYILKLKLFRLKFKTNIL